mgnify:FL=1
MDNPTENQENDLENEQALIDIFYKDAYRLNSLLSQINNGNLRNIMTTKENLHSSASTTKGELGIPKAANIGNTRNTSESEKRSIKETKTPLDDTIVQLLQQLNLPTETISPQKVFSSLRVIQGEISLKNYKLFSELIPNIGDFAILFDETIQKKQTLENRIEALRKMSSKDRNNRNLLQQLEKELLSLKLTTNDDTSMYKNLNILLPFLPKGVGFEVRLSDGSIFTGNLKSEYLIDPEESIFLNYGEHLPDQWNVLGIMDFAENTETETSTGDPITILSVCMKQISHTFLNCASQATIIPLLIYRNLSVQ